jgi:hypothetical protein
VSLTRKILLVLFFIGFAGNVGGGAGTFASFNASTTNALSSFATGSIVLSNENETSGKVCFSNGLTDDGAGTGTDDNDNLCETLFPVAVNQPGDSATVDLNLQNEGSLPGVLKLFVADHTPPGGGSAQKACSNTATGTYSGSGETGGVDFCEKLQLRIQRFTAATRNPATELDSCVYGADLGGDDACDTGATGFNLEEFTTTSAAAGVSGIDLGELAELGETGDSAFVTITVEFPNGAAGADNAYQGRVASFAISWVLEQTS